MSYYDEEITDHAVKCYSRLIRRRGEIHMQPCNIDTRRIGDEITIGNGGGEFARYAIICDEPGCESVRLIPPAKRRLMRRK